MDNYNEGKGLNIVGGNDFGLRIKVVRKVWNGTETEEQPVDLTNCTDIKVQLVGKVRSIDVPFTIDESDSSILNAKVSGAPLGSYGLDVSGTDIVGNWKAAYKVGDDIGIVRWSKDGNLLSYDKNGNGVVDMQASLDAIGITLQQQKELEEAIYNGKLYLTQVEAERSDMEAQVNAMASQEESRKKAEDARVKAEEARAEAEQKREQSVATAVANAKADIVGEDNYVYRWDASQGKYVKTETYVKGDKGDKLKYTDLTSDDKTDLASYNGIPLASESPADGDAVTLQPNHFTKITMPDAGGSVTISLQAPTDTSKAVDYDGELTVGTTVPTVTWDANITWSNTVPTLVAGSRYEFSVRYDGENYYGIMI